MLSNQILHKPINDIHEIMGVDCSVWSMEGKCLAIAGMNEDRIKAGVDKFLKEGKDVLHLAFSSGLSGTCNSMKLAQEELQEEYPDAKIYVMDTLCACMGEGMAIQAEWGI